MSEQNDSSNKNNQLSNVDSNNNNVLANIDMPDSMRQVVDTLSPYVANTLQSLNNDWNTMDAILPDDIINTAFIAVTVIDAVTIIGLLPMLFTGSFVLLFIMLFLFFGSHIVLHQNAIMSVDKTMPDTIRWLFNNIPNTNAASLARMYRLPEDTIRDILVHSYTPEEEKHIRKNLLLADSSESDSLHSGQPAADSDGVPPFMKPSNTSANGMTAAVSPCPFILPENVLSGAACIYSDAEHTKPVSYGQVFFSPDIRIPTLVKFDCKPEKLNEIHEAYIAISKCGYATLAEDSTDAYGIVMFENLPAGTYCCSLSPQTFYVEQNKMQAFHIVKHGYFTGVSLEHSDKTQMPHGSSKSVLTITDEHGNVVPKTPVVLLESNMLAKSVSDSLVVSINHTCVYANDAYMHDSVLSKHDIHLDAKCWHEILCSLGNTDATDIASVQSRWMKAYKSYAESDGKQIDIRHARNLHYSPIIRYNPARKAMEINENRTVVAAASNGSVRTAIDEDASGETGNVQNININITINEKPSSNQKNESSQQHQDSAGSSSSVSASKQAAPNSRRRKKKAAAQMDYEQIIEKLKQHAESADDGDSKKQ